LDRVPDDRSGSVELFDALIHLGQLCLGFLALPGCGCAVGVDKGEISATVKPAMEHMSEYLPGQSLGRCFCRVPRRPAGARSE
jgi:hypothetical protein